MLLFKKCNLRILADLAIKTVMGHRLEPKSQVLPSFKLTLREFPRVSNSHWLQSPITAIMASAGFFGIIFLFDWRAAFLLASIAGVIYTKVNQIGLHVFQEVYDVSTREIKREKSGAGLDATRAR